MITELFQNMLILHEQIDAFFDFRSPDQGFPALIVFCVYVCGSLANYLHQEPNICPGIAPQAEEIIQKSLTGLGQLQNAWPIARRWNTALCRASAVVRNHMVATPRRTNNHSGGWNQFGLDNEAYQNDSPGDVVRLSDPFPTDAMLVEFETYPWNDIFTSTGNMPGEQSIRDAI
jgi:hypothetical protein